MGSICLATDEAELKDRVKAVVVVKAKSKERVCVLCKLALYIKLN